MVFALYARRGKSRNRHGLPSHTIRKIGRGKFIHIPLVFSKIIKIISKVQLVNILVRQDRPKKCAFFLSISGVNSKNIRLIKCKTDRAWTRDFLNF